MAKFQWTPCSEKLPEKIGHYLVSNIYGGVYSTSVDYLREGKMCFGYYDDDDFFVEDDTVVAWMPLPEPYKKEGDKK